MQTWDVPPENGVENKASLDVLDCITGSHGSPAVIAPGSNPIIFASAKELLDHVTTNWRQNFVTVDLCTRHLVEPFIRRPFFMLISVDAPIYVRFTRANRCATSQFPGSIGPCLFHIVQLYRCQILFRITTALFLVAI